MTQQESLAEIEKLHQRHNIEMSNQIKWSLDDSDIGTDLYDAVKGLIYKFMSLAQQQCEERQAILKVIGQPPAV